MNGHVNSLKRPKIFGHFHSLSNLHKIWPESTRFHEGVTELHSSQDFCNLVIWWHRIGIIKIQLYLENIFRNMGQIAYWSLFQMSRNSSLILEIDAYVYKRRNSQLFRCVPQTGQRSLLILILDLRALAKPGTTPKIYNKRAFTTFRVDVHCLSFSNTFLRYADSFYLNI